MSNFFSAVGCAGITTVLLLFSCATPKKGMIVMQEAPRDIEIKTEPAYKPKPPSFYQNIKKEAAIDKGFFTLYKSDNRYYFEIPDSLLGKDMLVVNRISKAAAQLRPDRDYAGYGADQIGENVIQFSKSSNGKLLIKKMDYSSSRSSDSSENGMYRAVANSNLAPIMAVFDIKAYSPDLTSVLIDLTDYINNDNDLFFFSGQQRRLYNLGNLQQDKSYIQTVSSFPQNIEIKTVKTFVNGNSSLAQTLPLVTYELNTSIVLLPAIPWKPRRVDERVGYFGRGYVDFDVPHPQGFNNSWLVTRWRLEPHDSDIMKYNRGELVEPKKPIVYYIDPATPKKWIPYLKQGVMAWQKAFEKAGFKNAIYALEAPVNDPEWSLEDTRHSAIVYKASWVQNASGPNVNDPRTGEILESHINWYHNITEVLHDWYFVQASPSDPAARKMMLDDSLMGKLIAFVCSHEVGHTLGLAHNFAASAAVPVDSLRSKQWVTANGVCPSIMDYARFNYVAQPEDGLGQNELIPSIGVYDEWAIEWGYRWLPDFANADAERAYLNQWVIRKLQDPRLLYAYTGAKCQGEDLGDDAVKAGIYGIRNLRRIVPQLLNWATIPNENYDAANKMDDQIIYQFRRYITHVSELIAGRNYTPKTVEQQGPVLEYVAKERQQAAVSFLQEELFKTPDWLINKQLNAYTGAGSYAEILNLQKEMLTNILSPITLNRLFNWESLQLHGTYTVAELLDDLERGIWLELPGKQPVSLFRRNLQKAYVQQLVNLQAAIQAAPAGNVAMGDILSVVKAHKAQLLRKVKKAAPVMKDDASRWHLADVSDRLKTGISDELQAASDKGKTSAWQQRKDLLNWKDEVPSLDRIMLLPPANCWNNGGINETLR